MIRQVSWTGLRRSAIIDQQLWYLGRDIAGPCGNALLAYGFERRRPTGGSGSTAYLLRLAGDDESPANASGGMLVCWGFAIYAGAVLAGPATSEPARTCAALNEPTWAGACIERFRDTPGLIRSPVRSTLHQVADLPHAVAPVTEMDRAFATNTVRSIARTLIAYERWAITTLGAAHRQAALRDAPRHKRHRFSPIPELSAVWEELAFGHRRSATANDEHSAESEAA